MVRPKKIDRVAKKQIDLGSFHACALYEFETPASFVTCIEQVLTVSIKNTNVMSKSQFLDMFYLIKRQPSTNSVDEWSIVQNLSMFTETFVKASRVLDCFAIWDLRALRVRKNILRASVPTPFSLWSGLSLS